MLIYDNLINKIPTYLYLYDLRNVKNIYSYTNVNFGSR